MSPSDTPNSFEDKKRKAFPEEAEDSQKRIKIEDHPRAILCEEVSNWEDYEDRGPRELFV